MSAAVIIGDPASSTGTAALTGISDSVGGPVISRYGSAGRARQRGGDVRTDAPGRAERAPREPHRRNGCDTSSCIPSSRARSLQQAYDFDDDESVPLEPCTGLTIPYLMAALHIGCTSAREMPRNAENCRDLIRRSGGIGGGVPELPGMAQ